VVTKYQDSVRRALVSNMATRSSGLARPCAASSKVMIERKVRSSFSSTRATISSGGPYVSFWHASSDKCDGSHREHGVGTPLTGLCVTLCDRIYQVGHSRYLEDGEEREIGLRAASCRAECGASREPLGRIGGWKGNSIIALESAAPERDRLERDHPRTGAMPGHSLDPC
jgi:hypothetical protein